MRRASYGAVIIMLLLVGSFMIGNLTYSENQLTGDQILQKVEARDEEVMSGSLISYIQFENKYSDGTTSKTSFRSLGKNAEEGPDKTLIYFLKPKGFLFLAITPEQKDADIWIYAPSYEALKKLESEQQREQSFARSTFSYEDIGERSRTDDYNAEISGQETLEIQGKQMPCYVLELTAKPDAEADYPTGTMWVSKDAWLNLRSEYYNQAGNLERVMEVLVLGEFEGKLVIDKMINKNVIENSSTTIIFQKRIRPEDEIPDSVFEPENLPDFDPAKWGFTD